MAPELDGTVGAGVFGNTEWRLCVPFSIYVIIPF